MLLAELAHKLTKKENLRTFFLQTNALPLFDTTVGTSYPTTPIFRH